MDAPKCRNIPSCGKRHYGDCAKKGEEKPASSRPDRPKKKSSKAPALPHDNRRLYPASPPDILDRIDALEQIVDELLAGKKKRSEYMKIYMRDRRARDGS